MVLINRIFLTSMNANSKAVVVSKIAISVSRVAHDYRAIGYASCLEYFWAQDGGRFAISRLRIAVVGVGALGSELCQQLAEAGIKRVLVIDPDLLEPRNVKTSPFYAALLESLGPIATGQPKATLVVNSLQNRFLDLAWEARCEEIADVGFNDLRRCDLILSCPDSTLARVETTRASQALRIPMLDGGLMPDNLAEGRVSFFPANNCSACYLCGLSEVRRAEVLAYATSRSLGCGAVSEPESMTGTLSAAYFVAAKMVDQLRLLAASMSSAEIRNEGAFTDRLRSENSREIVGAEGRIFWERHRLVRSADCPWHQFDAPDQLIPMSGKETFEEVLFARYQDDQRAVLELPWPICLRSRCIACGFEDRPKKRVAHVRRKASCPRCGVRGKMVPVETVAAIRSGDRLAQCTTEQLGLPKQQLYRIRREMVFKRSGDSE